MNLKELARARGTNIKQLSEVSGIPATTLYAISRGDTNFDKVGIKMFFMLSESLGMSAEDLREFSITGEVPEHDEADETLSSEVDTKNESCIDTIDEDEHILLEQLHKMDDAQRSVLLSVAYELARKA